MNFGEKHIYNAWYDTIFVCFPVWIPFSFFFLNQFLPQNGTIIFLLAIFLLAETHFGATWLFFLDQNNNNYISNNLIIFLYIPVFILISAIIIWTYFGSAKLILIASIASAFHVTRQSIGINKLFSSKNIFTLKLSNYLIYGYSIYFLGIGFLRFFTNTVFPENFIFTINLAILLLGICFIILIFYLDNRKQNTIKIYMSTFTGMFLYFPYTFSENIEIAVTMGVGMHWMQYLAITIPLYLRKSEKYVEKNKKSFVGRITSKSFNIISFVIGYGALMVFLRQYETGLSYDYSTYFLIPLCLRLLHFYYDSFIWRFSESHIQKQVGKFIFTKGG